MPTLLGALQTRMHPAGNLTKRGKGEMKSHPEERPVGISPVVSAQSRVLTPQGGDTGNAGKSSCSSSGGKARPEVPQGAVEDGGETGLRGGARLQECGEDGDKAVGEGLGVDQPADPWPPKSL